MEYENQQGYGNQIVRGILEGDVPHTLVDFQGDPRPFPPSKITKGLGNVAF